MAVLTVVLGGLIGFVSFIVALVAFDASFLQALGLYMGTGFAFTGLGIASMLLSSEELGVQKIA